MNPGCLPGSSVDVLLPHKKRFMEEVPAKASWQNLARWQSGQPFLAKSWNYVPNYEFLPLPTVRIK